MATLKSFEEIHAWQKTRVLNQKVGNYLDTRRFKQNYWIEAQIEGAAGYIMDNLAEGSGRSGNKAFLQFLCVSKGACDAFSFSAPPGTGREMYPTRSVSMNCSPFGRKGL
jgi:hypothetical protein